MNVQPSLFDQPTREPPRARRNDPATSKIAARGASDLAAAHEAKIRMALRTVVNATIYELEPLTGLDHVQIARRLPYMNDCSPDDNNTRPGPNKGRPCRCWKIARA